MEELNLKLTLAEINIILEAVGRKPYTEVFQLIQKIQQQAQIQIGDRESVGELNS